jgi:hypothetical protein
MIKRSSASPSQPVAIRRAEQTSAKIAFTGMSVSGP